ncbi:MAG: hypothetical protein R6V35_00120 [Candidatus Nanohaloarchaea archaeon]
MIEFLTSTGYDIVEASWHTTAVFAKFYLLIVLFRSKDELTLEKVEELVLEESKQVLGLFLGIGVLSLIAGIEIRPLFPLISEGVALIYLGYLFWEF